MKAPRVPLAVAIALASLVPGSLAATKGSWLAIGAVAATAAACAVLVLLVAAADRALAQAATREAMVQAHAAGLELKSRALSEQIEHVRVTDELTGILNRPAFLARLDETIRRDARLGKPLSFLLIDVQGFRAINETLGRLKGDEVLQQVARALQSATRGTDGVGRIGGDEFAVVLGECAEPRSVVDRLFVSLSGLAFAGGEPSEVTASVGAVVVESPADGIEAREIVRLAEVALTGVRQSKGSAFGRRTVPRHGSKVAAV